MFGLKLTFKSCELQLKLGESNIPGNLQVKGKKLHSKQISIPSQSTSPEYETLFFFQLSIITYKIVIDMIKHILIAE